jgi:hypothetical protein
VPYPSSSEAGNIKSESFKSKCQAHFARRRKEMMLPTQTRDLAQRLLAYENAEGKTSERKEFAAVRVCERLRQPLIKLAGVAGFRSLLSRALTLARAEAPSLSAVQVATDGSLNGLDELAPQTNKGQARDGGAVLIAQLLGLLLTLIGEGSTLRLVQDVWPEAVFDGHVLEKERKA